MKPAARSSRALALFVTCFGIAFAWFPAKATIASINRPAPPPDTRTAPDRGEAWLRAEVLDPVTGRPVPGLLEVRGQKLEAVVDTGGHAELRRLRPGSEDVQAIAYGSRQVTLYRVPLHAGQVTRARFYVSAPDGRPEQRITCVQGCFRADGAPAGARWKIQGRAGTWDGAEWKPLAAASVGCADSGQLVAPGKAGEFVLSGAAGATQSVVLWPWGVRVVDRYAPGEARQPEPVRLTVPVQPGWAVQAQLVLNVPRWWESGMAVPADTARGTAGSIAPANPAPLHLDDSAFDTLAWSAGEPPGRDEAWLHLEAVDARTHRPVNDGVVVLHDLRVGGALDTGGHARMRGLRPGIHDVTVRTMSTEDLTLDSVTFAPGRITEARVFLRPRSSTTAPPATVVEGWSRLRGRRAGLPCVIRGHAVEWVDGKTQRVEVGSVSLPELRVGIGFEHGNFACSLPVFRSGGPMLLTVRPFFPDLDSMPFPFLSEPGVSKQVLFVGFRDIVKEDAR